MAVVDTITGGHAGNYLVYFPSYKYMEEIQQRFAAEHPDVTTIMQSRGMEEEDRQAFLDQFDADNAEVLVGFAVMGILVVLGLSLWQMMWLFWAFIALLLINFGHPPPLNDLVPLGRKRKMLAYAMIVIFVLLFMPAPLTIMNP